LNWKGWVIIGTPKCGQISMNQYLIDRFPLVGRVRKHEIIWKKDCIPIYKAELLRGGLRPIIMIRDPIARMWSAYHYFPGMKEKYPDPIDFLSHKGYSTIYGEENPVSGSNYWKWIRQWEQFDPIVINLEDMKRNPNYPKKNLGVERTPDYDPTPTKEFIKEAKTALKIEIELHKTPSWSIDKDFDMLW